MSEAAVPKLFLSYSWTTPEHEAWVAELAGHLNDSGVHVIFDKWDLKEGHESTAFMEQMVADPTVTKVLMICDQKYAERADRREGGAGTEAQIISSKIYQADDSKFVAAVRERDENGKAYVPTYYASRIYIDFSDDARYGSEFEKLLRWIYGQPLNPRPPLGTKPAFLNATQENVRLGTAMEQRRAIDALKADKSMANAAVSDYLTKLSDGLEQFRIAPHTPEPFDDAVVQSIEDFIPYRNEAIELFRTLARYRADEGSQRALHRFFEKLLGYNSVPEGVSSYRTTDFDNFKFITHELLLYAVASFIAEEKFDFIDGLLATPYYLPSRSERGRAPTVGFDAFWAHAESLEHRNNRLEQRRYSLHADMLKARAAGSGFDFKALMQADFSLYMRNFFIDSDEYHHWYPVTLVYTANYPSTFEIYARAKSEKYWLKMRPLLAHVELNAVRELCDQIEKRQVAVPRWEWNSLQIKVLFGVDKTATVA